MDSFAIIIDNLNFGALGQAYLVNREGQLLIRTEEFNYYLARISSRHAFTLADSYAVQQILQKENGKGIYKDFAGRKVLGSFEWVESLQAGLIVEFSDHKVMQPLYLLFRVIAVLAIGVILLGLLMAFFISQRTTKHLNELVNAASNIANQDYQHPLELKTNTEFDILINQFNQMQSAIKAREKSLQEKNLELKMQRAEAIEATKMKSQFLANMSHELRTPLNSIIGFTSRVIKKCGIMLPSIQLENLEIVKSEAQNLLDLINDLLDFSKIEAGRMEVNIDEFNLIEEIREVNHIIQPLQESKLLGYVQDLYQNDVISIASDRIKVRQILINLLSNAFKYSEKGTVTLSVNEEDGYYRISVTDEGIGIASENITGIFDEFRQIDGSYTRKVGGTGLGLSITRKFVEMLQGRIQVSSTLGEGSTFTVYLPIHFDMPNIVTEQVAASVPPTTVTKLKVVCIDDDLNVCRLYKQYLEEGGFEVITFYGQEDVVAQIAMIRPDIVLLDIILPQKDGWEILAELKTGSDTREIPVIMVSILSEKNLAYKLKADEYLVKPVSQEELTTTISRLLSTKHYPEVLVADDDVNYLNLISQFLLEESINFRLARDGEETLQMIKEKKPDLLLLDIMMPEKDGLAVLDEIQKRAEWDGMAIIMVTSKFLTKDEIVILKNRVLQIINKSGTHIEKIMTAILNIINEKTKNGLNSSISGSAQK